VFWFARRDSDPPIGRETLPVGFTAAVSFAPSPMTEFMARVIQKPLLSARKHALGAAVAVGCVLYLFPFMRVMLQRTDEGSFLCGAERLLRGQVFGRDFVEVMGPGTFYWLAAFYRALGVNAFAARACLMLTWITMALLVYRLSRPVAPAYRLLPLALILGTSFNSLVGGVSHHMVGNCLALLAVLCLSNWGSAPKTQWLACAGVFAGATALVHQPKGILILLAANTWIWMCWRKQRSTGKAVLQLTAGFFVILGVSALYFVGKGAFLDLFRAACIWPLQHYGRVNRVPYGWSTFAFYWHGVPLTSAGTYAVFLFASVLIVPFLFVAALPFLVSLQTLTRNVRSLSQHDWLYLICGVALWASELHRKDIVHLVFGSPLLIIVSIQLFSRSKKPFSRYILVGLTCSACTLVLCNLVGVLRAHVVSTRAGKIAVLEGGEEFSILNAEIAPGEEIFVYPYSPSYYFLTAARNPTRFSILVSGYNTPAEVSEVIHTLEEHHIQHVVWDTNSRKNMAVFSPDAVQFPDDLGPLERYLRIRYTIVYEKDGFRIMERRHESFAQ
jgi:hypothetical protein